MFLQGLIIVMASALIVFIVQTIRLAVLAHRSDPRSKSLTDSVRIILTIPWQSMSDSNTVKSRIVYYFDLLSGIMFTKYNEHLKRTISMVKVRCKSNPSDENIKNIVVNGFTRSVIIVASRDIAEDKSDFKRQVDKSVRVLINLINVDLHELVKPTNGTDLAEECPFEYNIIISIIQTSNLYDIDTNAIIIASLDYLQDIDLDKEYETA